MRIKIMRNLKSALSAVTTLMIASLIVIAFAGSAKADSITASGTGDSTGCPVNCLFYGGDLQVGSGQDNGLANETNSFVSQASVYAPFVVPGGQTWNVTSLFSNDLEITVSTSAFWDIRTGVSSGNAGTEVASGTAGSTITTTGRRDFGLNEYTNLVSVNLTLGTGTYWMTVDPVGNGTGRSFESNTCTPACGNAVGPAGPQFDSFLNSSYFGASYDPAGGKGGGSFPAFSDGVGGTSTTPEPSTLALLGTSLMGLLGLICRIRTL